MPWFGDEPFLYLRRRAIGNRLWDGPPPPIPANALTDSMVNNEPVTDSLFNNGYVTESV